MPPDPAPNRRLILFLALSLVLLIGAVAMLAVVGLQQATPDFNGTLLDPPDQATNFSLTDQTGRPYRLSEAKGKVVVLTFLYTDLLGDDAAQVDLVAITTDPARDTQPTLADYSRTLGLYDRWHFLYGPTDALRPIWKAYAVAAEKDTHAQEIETPHPLPPATVEALGLGRGLAAADVAAAQKAIGQFGGGYHVTHSTPIWLIDPQGRVRVLLRQSASPEEIAHDVRLLLP